jgi:hypothetical protein
MSAALALDRGGGGLRAPPRCTTEPDKLKCKMDSVYPWMKGGAQVVRLEATG